MGVKNYVCFPSTIVTIGTIFFEINLSSNICPDKNYGRSYGNKNTTNYNLKYKLKQTQMNDGTGQTTSTSFAAKHGAIDRRFGPITSSRIPLSGGGYSGGRYG